MDAPARRLALLLLLLALLPALAAIVGASQHDDSAQQQSPPWARGGYGLLTVAEDASMTFTFGNLTLHGAAPTGASGSTSPGAAGVDPQLGSFDELLLPAGAAGGFAIRYFSKLDAFTFERRPSNDSEAAALLDTTFPRFDGQPFEANSTDKALCMGWSNHYFFPGGVTSLNDCQTDGPLFLFEPLANGSTTTAAALALTPLLNFTLASVSPQLLGVTAKRPAQGSVALLLARPGFVRANRAVGSVLRQAHATTRLRGIGTSGLSYWSDNQAGYSWWSVGPDQMVWGQPEQIYTTLKKGYDAAKIPITNWEPDNHLTVKFHTPSGWNYVDWGTWNAELYPSGGNLSKLLGGIPLTFYYNGFEVDNVYAHSPKWGKKMHGEDILPLASYDFHKEIFGNAVANWNMQQLFTDFLSFRGNRQRSLRGNFGTDEPEHLWLGGQAMAAQDLGCEVQFCMAAAHQLLMSLEWPAVTNARANGDGGLDLEALLYTSVLASTVGLGWSKDNLRTADKCYVPAVYENGTQAYPCDGHCGSQFTNGHFQSQTAQTILATLSLGPVGISDQLTSRPEVAGANITSNRTLVMATCAANGTLLQPSYPLTPIEPLLLRAEGWQRSGTGHHGGSPKPAPHVWATYTAVKHGASVDVHFVVVGYWLRPGKMPHGANITLSVTLEEKHLSSMVDETALPSPDGFGAIPTGGFVGAGETFPNSTGGYVVWSADIVRQATEGGCSGVEVAAFDGSLALNLPDGGGVAGITGSGLQPALVNVAPVHGETALLGEAGKVTAVSVFRFASVASSASSSSGLTVTVRGAPGEAVELMFAKKGAGGAFVCVAKQAVVGADGTAVVTSG